MKTYEIRVSDRVEYLVEVKAKNESEAIKKIKGNIWEFNPVEDCSHGSYDIIDIEEIEEE